MYKCSTANTFNNLSVWTIFERLRRRHGYGQMIIAITIGLVFGTSTVDVDFPHQRVAL